MELFDNFFDYGGGLHFLTRYAHVLFGITWIGLLYFFNFVQVPAFAEMEARPVPKRCASSRFGRSGGSAGPPR